MSLHQRRQAASANCPWGGFFQACATGFRGCCSVDACTNGCPAGKDTTSGAGDTSEGPVPTSTRKIGVTSTWASNARPTGTSHIEQGSAPASTSSSPSSISTSILINDVFATRSSTGSSASSRTGPSEPVHIDHSLPTASIVGGVLGGIIVVIAISVVVFLCLRKRSRKVYYSPKYPSPLIGSDMSDELGRETAEEGKSKKFALYRSESKASRLSTPQLDSREIGWHQAAHRDPLRLFAELPGESLPWPGQSGPGRSP